MSIICLCTLPRFRLDAYNMWYIDIDRMKELIEMVCLIAIVGFVDNILIIELININRRSKLLLYTTAIIFRSKIMERYEER